MTIRAHKIKIDESLGNEMLAMGHVQGSLSLQHAGAFTLPSHCECGSFSLSTLRSPLQMGLKLTLTLQLINAKKEANATSQT